MAEDNTGILDLIKNFDPKKLSAIAEHIDLGKVLESLSNMDKAQLLNLKRSLEAGADEYEPPEIKSDFYQLYDQLSGEERDLQKRVRRFMEDEVQPIANEFWLKGEFPHHLIPKMADLGICGLPLEGYGCMNHSYLMEGIISLEMARVDASISTFFGIQSGLVMSSVYFCGSEKQKKKWLPKLRTMELIGAFGLTEPKVGSAVAGGLTTKARKEGDHWVLNGKKKWIGNGTFSDITIIWAQDVDDGQVKGFIVENDTPGFTAEKQKDKMALRTVQNARLYLDDCKVPAENKLEHANSFKDTSKVLRATRAGVAWQAIGCAQGAYEYAVDYTHKRKQFGKTIGSFQLVQDLLVEMLSDLTAMQTMAFRLSQLQDEGKMTDEQASLAKVSCTTHTRSVVEKAREILGGNGILLKYNVARFVADAEAIYTYEGTKQVNSLIVGRALTGKSAFI